MEKRVKNHLYVGGIAEDVTEELLRAAFIPFGDIKDVLIPREHSTNKPRGFGFVTFEEEDDAAEAMDNMHESELAGRVLNVRMAKPRAVNKNRAVWSADEWMEKNLQVNARGPTAVTIGLGVGLLGVGLLGVGLLSVGSRVGHGLRVRFGSVPMAAFSDAALAFP